MVIVKCLNMPMACYLCTFSRRFDNFHTYCKFHAEELVEDGAPIPEYCELVDYKEEEKEE